MSHWMVICLLMMLLSQTISQQETFSTISCSFDLLKDRNNPEAFSISSCKWSSCWKWVSNGEKRTCVEYQQYIVKNNWQSCMVQCCNDGTLSQTYESLNKCYYDNKQSTWHVWLIAISLVSIGVIVSCIIACRPIQMKKTIHDSKCLICQRRGVNLSLWCSHHFHKECFYIKMTSIYYSGDKIECPICKQNAYSIKLYCKKCLKLMVRRVYRDNQNLKNQKEVCDQCINN